VRVQRQFLLLTSNRLYRGGGNLTHRENDQPTTSNLQNFAIFTWYIKKVTLYCLYESATPICDIQCHKSLRMEWRPTNKKCNNDCHWNIQIK